MSVHATGDAAADALLNTDANALLFGMVLDQQVPIEWAFAGPHTLRDRLGHLDPVRIAAMPEDEFVVVACEKPAIHRYPAMMAKRLHRLSRTLVDDYDGDAHNIWGEVDDAAALRKRLSALPGFGPEKTKIFVALLAKRFDVQPAGWQQVADVFADDQPRSVADMADATTAAAVRAWKTQQKAARLDKQDQPLND